MLFRVPSALRSRHGLGSVVSLYHKNSVARLQRNGVLGISYSRMATPPKAFLLSELYGSMSFSRIA